MLEIGDTIQRYEFDKPIGSVYIIDRVTKTLAKSEYATFVRAIGLNNTVERKDDFWAYSKKYVLVKE